MDNKVNGQRFVIGGGSSSKRGLHDVQQTKITPPQRRSKERFQKDVIYLQTKEEVKIEGRPWNSKKANATKTEPYEPCQFVGLHICKEHNGVRSLGTVIGYSPEKNNKLIVQYKDDGMIEYMTQVEALYGMAKREDFLPAQPAPIASNRSNKKTDKKKVNMGEGSTTTKKK